MSRPGFFYAVKKGRQPGIFKTWEECSAQVHGYAGARYKRFGSRREALAFMEAPDPAPRTRTARATKGEEPIDHGNTIIYTDGGALTNPGPGGYGVVLVQGQERKEFKGGFRRTTNNRMEIMAVLVGLGALPRPSSVTVFTDSRYVHDSLTLGWITRWQRNGWKTTEGTPVANADLWKQLDELCKKHKVQFKWIPGHRGKVENERCDELATQMARSHDLPPDHGYETRFDQ